MFRTELTDLGPQEQTPILLARAKRGIYHPLNKADGSPIREIVYVIFSESDTMFLKGDSSSFGLFSSCLVKKSTHKDTLLVVAPEGTSINLTSYGLR